MKDDEKNEIVKNKCFTPKIKKANKIRLELLSLTKDQLVKQETKFNNRFSISKKEKVEIKEKEKKDDKEKVDVEQNSNVIINSNNSDTDDSGIDSSDMSGCEEEEII